ncbi:MAG: PQQ-binding-like beta-propeller repeat protein [Candidatus Bathyarchaeia archaeon]
MNKKTNITAIISVVLLAISIIMNTMPAQAQSSVYVGSPELPAWPTTPPAGVTPSVTIETTAFMSIRPDPVGIGQTILVNLWLEPATHYARYRSGYTVTFTKPDGTIDVVGPINSYQGDTTAWFEYVVDQVGTWKAKFEAAGNYFPAGWYYNGKVYPSQQAIIESGVNPNFASFSRPTYLDSAYYKPATTKEQTFTVQNDMVLSWPEAQLPTDYWSRPIPIENREWWIIGGHYPFAGEGGGPGWPENTNRFASNYKYVPYVQAPNTAHIAWKRQGALAGIAGGQYGYRSMGSGEGTYAGTPNIIFQGRAYQTVTKPMPMTVNGSTVVEATSVWQCYDIRTGEIYWEQTGITQPPTVITYNEAVTSVPGAAQTGLGTGSWSLMYIGSRLIKYDPWSGAATLNISLPVSSGTYYKEPYVLSVQTINATAGKYRLINWTTTGSDTNFTTRIMNNISWPFSTVGTVDYESMIAVATGSIIPSGAGHPTGQFLMGASLITGDLLWNVTTNDIFFSTSTGVADHGKYAVRMLGGWWNCWDLYTGKLLWKSDVAAYPWGDFGAYNIASYGGLFYDLSYHGIYAWNWTTGKVAWHFLQPGNSGYETPYGTWPFFTNPMIADGKLYVSNGEHSPTQPLQRGWRLFCLNATTGEMLWDFSGGGTVGAIADGYLTFDSRYSGHLYVFGKGKTKTTVSAPQTAVTLGQSVVITGSVLDMSPAQPSTACVSKESMTAWMEYLHMQKPIPSEVKGVPVSLDAVDPNGNWQHIGDVVTDGLTGTFGYMWKPEIAGKYTVTATFMGDDSYGSSFATTYVGVAEAPPATATPPSIEVPDYMPMMYALLTGIIIAIIVGLAALFKKR